MKIKRRALIKNALGITALATLAGCEAGTPDQPGKSPSVSKSIVKWRMITAFPKDSPGADTHAQLIANDIAKATDGRLLIDHFAGGEIVPPYEVFDAVRDGTAQCGYDAPYYWIAKHKAIPFFCTVPGGMTGYELFAWIVHGGGQKLWDELYADFNLKSFPAGNTGVQMGGWFQKEINTIEDLKGLKMRIPGLGAEVMNRLGVTAVNMPAGEIMPALQQGVIDATEWVGPWADLAFGFYKIAKYYYGPGVHEGGSGTELVMNKESWDSLDEDIKHIVKMVCHKNAFYGYTQFFTRNAESLKVLVADYNVDIRNFPQNVISTMHKISREVVEEIAKEGELHNRIYTSWKSFFDQSVDYQKYSDFGFMKDREAANS